jgi:hypothetical protein
MNCKDFRNELLIWLEAMWGENFPARPSLPESMNTHAQACESCAQALRKAYSVAELKDSSAQPSALITSRITERINQKVHGKKFLRFPSLAPSAVYAKARAAMLPVALTAALIAMVFTGLILVGDNPVRKNGVTVRFSLEAPTADQVNVVGDWNGWNPAANPLLDDDGDGIWETEIELLPGKEYRYQFFIDDNTWIADPQAPLKIEDGFGGLNSILRI